MTTQTQQADFMSLDAASRESPLKKIDPDKPIWIFGAGLFGQRLCGAMQARDFEVAGFVDNSDRKSEALGLPVKNWQAFSRDASKAQLALGMQNHYVGYEDLLTKHMPVEFNDMLLMPWDTYEVLHREMGWQYWLSRRDVLLDQLDRVARVASRLADDTSRRLLYRTTAFRLGLDTPFSTYLSTEQRYFNPLTLTTKPITYVDCGAYTGDTYADLLAEPGADCRRAYLLEPDPANYRKLVANVSSTSPEVICLPLAAAEDYCILSFNSGDGEASAVSQNGDVHIAATGLDQLLPNERVDIIKLDVEGSEAPVLRGARHIITRWRPSLLVSLYHNPQDLWELPELLFEICDNYDFYIRQHQFNTFDSVLYAIPRVH